MKASSALGVPAEPGVPSFARGGDRVCVTEHEAEKAGAMKKSCFLFAGLLIGFACSSPTRSTEGGGTGGEEEGTGEGDVDMSGQDGFT